MATTSDRGVAVRAHGLVVERGSTTAISASDLEIPTGSITAIIGPNGSGKSSLLHAIAGLVSPAAGNLAVLGRSPAQVRERISYVLQYTTVPAGTPITVDECG